MKLPKISIKDIVIVVLIFIVFLQTCNTPPSPQNIVKVEGKKYELVKTITDTQYISEYKTKWKKGDSIPFVVKLHDTIQANVDTLIILKDYYSVKIYTDTFKLNYGQFRIKDTVSQNKVIGRSYDADLLIPMQKEYTIVKELPKVQMYIGFNAVFNRVDGLSSFGPKIFLKSKKDHLYWIGAGLGLQSNPNLNLGVAWKIKFK